MEMEKILILLLIFDGEYLNLEKSSIYKWYYPNSSFLRFEG